MVMDFDLNLELFSNIIHEAWKNALMSHMTNQCYEGN